MWQRPLQSPTGTLLVWNSYWRCFRRCIVGFLLFIAILRGQGFLANVAGMDPRVLCGGMVPSRNAMDAMLSAKGSTLPRFLFGSCSIHVRYVSFGARLRTQEDGKVFLPFLEPWKQPPPRDPDVHVEFSHTDQEALPGPWQRTLIEDIDLFFSIHFHSFPTLVILMAIGPNNTSPNARAFISHATTCKLRLMNIQEELGLHHAASVSTCFACFSSLMLVASPRGYKKTYLFKAVQHLARWPKSSCDLILSFSTSHAEPLSASYLHSYSGDATAVWPRAYECHTDVHRSLELGPLIRTESCRWIVCFIHFFAQDCI